MFYPKFDFLINMNLLGFLSADTFVYALLKWHALGQSKYGLESFTVSNPALLVEHAKEWGS